VSSPSLKAEGRATPLAKPGFPPAAAGQLIVPPNGRGPSNEFTLSRPEVLVAEPIDDTVHDIRNGLIAKMLLVFPVLVPGAWRVEKKPCLKMPTTPPGLVTDHVMYDIPEGDHAKITYWSAALKDGMVTRSTEFKQQKLPKVVRRAGGVIWTRADQKASISV